MVVEEEGELTHMIRERSKFCSNTPHKGLTFLRAELC